MNKIHRSFILILCLVFFNVSFLFAFDEENSDKKSKRLAQYNFKIDHTSLYYYKLGNRFFQLKNYEEAIRNYEYSLLVDKNCGECYYNLGKIYYYKKLYQESSSNLKVAITHQFEFFYDKLKANYLLSIDYFYINKPFKAVQVLKKIIADYKDLQDKEGKDSPLIHNDYYSPAYFLLSLYYRNNKLFLANNLYILQRTLQLNYKKEYINYFLYEYYTDAKQPSIAFTYLTQAKILDPNIEENIKNASWIKNYDIFNNIDKF